MVNVQLQLSATNDSSRKRTFLNWGNITQSFYTLVAKKEQDVYNDVSIGWRQRLIKKWHTF